MSFGLGIGHLIPIFIYVGAIVAFLLSVFWRPQVGLYYLIPFLPLQTTRYRLHDLPWGEKFIDILLLGVVIGLLIRDARLFQKTPMNRIFLVLGVMTYLALWRGSAYLGMAPPVSLSDLRFSDWKKYLEMPFIALLVVAVFRDLKQLKLVVLLMALSTLLVNWSFVVTTRGRDFSHFSYGLRDSGVLGYAGENGFAAYEGQIMAFLLAFYAFAKNKFVKYSLLAVVAFSGYCLLFGYSRGGYLAILAALAFFGLFRERKILVGVIVILIGWQALLPTSVRERITMTYDKDVRVRQGYDMEDQYDVDSTSRLELWQDAQTLFLQSPVIGLGYDTYRYLDRVGPYRDTHNYYIKVAVETGVVGLLIFLSLLGLMFRQGWRLFRCADDPFLKAMGLGFAALMVCAIVVNVFGDRWTYIQVNGFLWVILGCVMRGQKIFEESREQAGETLVPASSIPQLAGGPSAV
jgi:putative inorganic carbon (HCO3(-)) transporter